jgi:hypothetical protein
MTTSMYGMMEVSRTASFAAIFVVMPRAPMETRSYWLLHTGCDEFISNRVSHYSGIERPSYHNADSKSAFSIQVS